MEVNRAELAAVGVKTEQFPDDGLPEVAFLGKSNVGKSTLINALMNRKALARTSSQPGKTRTINFYRVEAALYLVDLPGYGYAKAPKSEIDAWGRFIESYLHTRRTLRGVVLLVDLRHEPGTNDKMMADWLRHYEFPMVVAATKADKLNRSQVPRQVKLLREGLGMTPEELVIPFSGVEKTGKEELWTVLDSWVAKGL